MLGMLQFAQHASPLVKFKNHPADSLGVIKDVWQTVLDLQEVCVEVFLKSCAQVCQLLFVFEKALPYVNSVVVFIKIVCPAFFLLAVGLLKVTLELLEHEVHKLLLVWASEVKSDHVTKRKGSASFDHKYSHLLQKLKVTEGVGRLVMANLSYLEFNKIVALQ